MEIFLLSVIVVAIIISAAIQAHTANDQQELLDQIHTLVNSRLTEALDDIAALKQALVEERRTKKRGK